MIPDFLKLSAGMVAVLFWTARIGSAEPAATGSADYEFFERRIRPALADRCYECHSASTGKTKGGLQLETREGLLKGGDSGPALVPGAPEESLLIRAIRYKDDHLQMPPKQKLPDTVIADFEAWIAQGAPDPRSGESAETPDASGIDFAAARAFWSFQPPREQPLPEIRHADWPRRRIDNFILSRLEEGGMAPAPRADARTLLRRAAFTLTGLPPAPEELKAFVDDASAEAYEKQIERLLASPHYGERWARVWLDKARYTDVVSGTETSRAAPWLYRDWVIQALQEDLPYDQFVKRQLATDLMPETGPEDLAALGLLGLSPTYWKELMLQKSLIQTVVAEEWEERMDTVGRTFLGLTLACARCHDHKYDPISHEDYYALAGVLASTRLTHRPLVAEEEFEPVRRARQDAATVTDEVAKLRKQIADSKAKAARQDKEQPTPVSDGEPDANDGIEARIVELEGRLSTLKSMPGFDQNLAVAVDDAALYVVEDGPNRTKLEYRPGEPRDLHVHLRGNPSNEGRQVPRGFLEVLSPGARKEFKQGSGRLELAEAIVNEGAPLSARVMVNRVWEQHFGKGLVDTPGNFGARGSEPTHPELLDDLTARFIENGWSLKWLHRELLLSATFQQSTAYTAENHRVDPENLLLWRMNRRRLEIEPWRDAVLAASGTLDRRVGGAADDLGDASHVRRTLYGRVSRTALNDMLRLHDFPDPSIHGEQRIPTTTPIQQLFVLNSDFMLRQAANLFRRMEMANSAGIEARVQQVYGWLFGRPAAAREVAWAREFLEREDDSADASEEEQWRPYLHALLASNEFLFID